MDVPGANEEHTGRQEFEFNWIPAAPVDPPATKELSGQMVKLLTADNEELEVHVEAARMSTTIRNMMDDIGDGGDNVIPLPNITLSILKLVMEYCTWHYIHWTEPPEVREGELERKTTDDIIPWDKAFTQKLDMATLYDVILAANFLDIRPLLDLTCKVVAIGIKECKTAEEIRKYLGVKNDYTPAEEEAVVRDNLWIETGKIIN